MKSYNVIVVGAGTAGAPLAARLSEDPARSVLLLEAGPDAPTQSDFPADLRDGRLMSGAMPGHPDNWSFSGMLTPKLPYAVPRGKILGGTSSINGVYFVRPRRIDMDRWVSEGHTEWSAEKLLPVLRRMEDDQLYGASEMHGAGGPLPVYREVDNPSLFTRAFYAAAAELGFEEDADKNDIDQLTGYGPMPRNSRNGMRINTGMAYIDTVRAKRPNLTVQGGALVHRVMFEGTRAVGVVVERGGRVEEVRADEVVLAAGSINTAHLLMLSGLGPAQELRAAGVHVLADMPAVGKNFSDHVDASLNWKPTRALREDDVNVRQLFEGTLNWTAEGSHTPSDLEIFPMLRSFDKAMGGAFKAALARPFGTLGALIPGVSLTRLTGQLLKGFGLSFSVLVNQPDSLGNVTLRSSDPHKQPHLDYNYLSASRDLERLREAMRTAARLLETKAFAPYMGKMTELDADTLNDDHALNAWMKKSLSLAIHMTGTAKMGSASDPATVVDQYGRVHGVDGLRVADISILPTSPTRAPAATAVMIGERISDFIIAPTAR